MQDGSFWPGRQQRCVCKAPGMAALHVTSARRALYVRVCNLDHRSDPILVDLQGQEPERTGKVRVETSFTCA